MVGAVKVVHNHYSTKSIDFTDNKEGIYVEVYQKMAT